MVWLFGIITLYLLVVAIIAVIRKVVVRNRLAALQGKLNELRETVEAALADVSTKYNFGHYITESERLDVEEKYSYLCCQLRSIINNKLIDKCEGTEPFIRLNKALSDTIGFKEINNSKFIEEQLAKHEWRFRRKVTVCPISK